VACASLPPAVHPLSADDPRASLQLHALAQLAAARRGLRAVTKVSLEGPQGASSSRQLMLLERPARMRLEVLGLLGQRLAILATDGEHYQLYRSQSAQIETGDVHPGILWDLAGVPLRPEQAVSLLLGAPQLSAAASSPSADLDTAGNLRLHWVGASLDFDPEGRLRDYIEHVRGFGQTLVEAHYANYDAHSFARVVELRFPAAGSRVRVEFRDVELNPQLSPALFQLRATGRTQPPSRNALR